MKQIRVKSLKKFLLTGVRTIGPPVSTGTRAAAGVWCNWQRRCFGEPLKHAWDHSRTGRHFTGGRKQFALKITIFPKNKKIALKLAFLVSSEGGLKPLVNLLYIVEFVYNGFVCNVNSPITLHFVRSRCHLLHAFQFAYNVNSAITFILQSPRGAVIGKFCSYLAC